MSALSGNPLAVELAERGDIPGAVAAQMASAKRNGSHPDGVKRSGKLFLAMCERILKGKVAQLQWEVGLLKLEAHGPEGKAAATGLRMELLEEQMEQIKLNPRVQSGGKAMRGMDTGIERRFCLFIEALGGGPADGQGRLYAEALNAAGAVFDRAAELWNGTADPESVTDAERRALERWRTSPDVQNPGSSRGSGRGEGCTVDTAKSTS